MLLPLKAPATEEVVVDEGVHRTHAAPLCVFAVPLCCKARRAGVPHESGSGTASLSGDKVIRTGNNERERKS